MIEVLFGAYGWVEIANVVLNALIAMVSALLGAEAWARMGGITGAWLLALGMAHCCYRGMLAYQYAAGTLSGPQAQPVFMVLNVVILAALVAAGRTWVQA